MVARLTGFEATDVEGQQHEFEADSGVFDYDGTLASGWEELLVSIQEGIFAELDFICPPHAALRGKLPDEVRKIMRSAQLPQRQAEFDQAWPFIFETFCKRADARLSEHDFRMDLYPDTAKLITQMGLLPRGIATNSSRALYDVRSARTPGLDQLGFKAVRTASCVPKGKPDPTMLLSVQRELGANCLFMAGDSLSDAHAGANAKWTTLIVGRGRKHEELQPFRLPGVIVVHSFADVRLVG